MGKTITADRGQLVTVCCFGILGILCSYTHQIPVITECAMNCTLKLKSRLYLWYLTQDIWIQISV